MGNNKSQLVVAAIENGTGSLFTCGGNLLGNISSGKDQLCVADTIILDKYNFDLSFDGRIVVYDIPNGIDQFDDCFCTLIASRSFAVIENSF